MGADTEGMKKNRGRGAEIEHGTYNYSSKCTKKELSSVVMEIEEKDLNAVFEMHSFQKKNMV